MSTLSLTRTFSEAHAMIPETPKAIYKAMNEDAKTGPLAKPLMLARVIAITTAMVGAIPTVTTLYQSWSHGVPYSEVSHRVAQYDLWEKNFECKIEYRTLNTGQGARIDVGACPKSGDVALKITAPNGKSAYEWIAYDKLHKASVVSGLMSYIVSSAEAAEPIARPASTAAIPAATPATAPVQIAQAAAPGGTAAGMQVVCQAKADKSKIVRIVNEGGKCFRENFSPYQGTVDKREEVPCNTQCTAGKS
jgi:hypothetical protein